MTNKCIPIKQISVIGSTLIIPTEDAISLICVQCSGLKSSYLLDVAHITDEQMSRIERLHRVARRCSCPHEVNDESHSPLGSSAGDL
jgi:mitochondrial fission protein ELM1